MVEPGAEQPQAAQLAPVLMRVDIVGVVFARALKVERAQRLAVEELAGDHLDGAVGTDRYVLEQILDETRVSGVTTPVSQRNLAPSSTSYSGVHRAR